MGRVAAGLVTGDLSPLADYFRAGYTDIDEVIALELADMIGGGDGHMPYRIETKSRTKRPGGIAKEAQDRRRIMAIGVWVEREIRASPRGAYEGIIDEACERFGRGKTAITDAHRRLKAMLAEAQRTISEDQLLAYWADIYSGDIDLSAD